MPRGLNLEDQANKQGWFINAAIRHIDPIMLDVRRRTIGFSGASTLYSYTVQANKIYRLAFNYQKQGGANIRIVGTTIGTTNLIVLGNYGRIVRPVYSIGTSLTIEADSTVFTGVLGQLNVMQVPPFTTLSGDRYFNAPDSYWSIGAGCSYGPNRIDCANAGYIMQQRTNMLTATTYNFSFNANMTTGSGLQLSNHYTDGTTVVWSDFLAAGPNTKSGSFTTSGAAFDWITLGASGSGFDGSISNFVITP